MLYGSEIKKLLPHIEKILRVFRFVLIQISRLLDKKI